MVNGFECSLLKPSESKSSVPLAVATVVKALFLNHDMFKYEQVWALFNPEASASQAGTKEGLYFGFFVFFFPY